MKYTVDYRKPTEQLTPDERNAQRRNQNGLWIATGFSCELPTGRFVRRLYRKAQIETPWICGPALAEIRVRRES